MENTAIDEIYKLDFLAHQLLNRDIKLAKESYPVSLLFKSLKKFKYTESLRYLLPIFCVSTKQPKL